MHDADVEFNQPAAMGGVASGLPAEERDDQHMRVSITDGRLEVSAILSDETEIDELMKILTVIKVLFKH
jgi:hypothetical protein